MLQILAQWKWSSYFAPNLLTLTLVGVLRGGVQIWPVLPACSVVTMANFLTCECESILTSTLKAILITTNYFSYTMCPSFILTFLFLKKHPGIIMICSTWCFSSLTHFIWVSSLILEALSWHRGELAHFGASIPCWKKDVWSIDPVSEGGSLSSFH